MIIRADAPGLLKMKMNAMQNISRYRLLLLCGTLTLGFALTACNGDNSKLNKGNNSDKEADVGDKVDAAGQNTDDVQEQEEEADTNTSDPDENDGDDVVDAPSAPGFMNGAWRVGTQADDATIAHFDLVQTEGNPAITGGFLTGDGLYEGLLEGGVGQLAESSYDGTTLTIQWNPTTQDVEMLTLSATKDDDDTFSGNITAVQNVELDMPVKMTREEDAPGH